MSAYARRRRIAIMATFAMIKENQFDDTFRIADQLIDDKHDLIHKATGWMLREVGKVNKGELELFLARNARQMPRTMLRYAIEKLPKEERRTWMER